MFMLPKDISKLICSYLEEYEFFRIMNLFNLVEEDYIFSEYKLKYYLRCADSLYDGHLPITIGNDLRFIYKMIDSINSTPRLICYKYGCDKQDALLYLQNFIIRHAYKQGDINILKQMEQRYSYIFNESILSFSEPHIKVVRYLYSVGYRIKDPNCLSYIFKSDNVELMCFLQDYPSKSTVRPKECKHLNKLNWKHKLVYLNIASQEVIASYIISTPIILPAILGYRDITGVISFGLCLCLTLTLGYYYDKNITNCKLPIN